MHERRSARARGQTLIVMAISAVAVVALVALAVDGGNAYTARRNAQNAADAAALAGTWVLADYEGTDPAGDILARMNLIAEQGGVLDTNGTPADTVNDNLLAYYVDAGGTHVSCDGVNWELHSCSGSTPPEAAHGIEAVAAISRTTFFARAIGVNQVAAQAHATARFEPASGMLPIAVNEYWLGSQGHCPYANCGEPNSFVRNPEDEVGDPLPPPFSPQGSGWIRNNCSTPYTEGTCQGPYPDVTDSNFGRAFAILGDDAKPNYGSNDPRSGVELNYRFDALVEDGYWHSLESCAITGTNPCVWQDNVSPYPPGQGAHVMEAMIKSGGYREQLPEVLIEPPIDYLEEWGYCWGAAPDDCFNAPAQGRSQPYDVLQFLKGAQASAMAGAMYDEGHYVQGRYTPGQRIAVLVYNSAPGAQWGPNGKTADTAPIVGYIGVVIVGYGTNMSSYPHCNCPRGEAGLSCFQGCIHHSGHGGPTVYGLVPLCYKKDAAGNCLVPGGIHTDPAFLLEEFVPKQIELIR